VRTAAVEKVVDPNRAAVGSHCHSPRANAREDTVHLENEAFTVEDREGRRWEEEGP
jgi:hypothetical protein